MLAFVMLMPFLGYAQGNGGTKKKKQKTEQTQPKKKKQTRSNTVKPRQESQRQVEIQRKQEAEAQRHRKDEAQRQREAEEVTRRSQIGEINGYKYVDLGLPSGLKWATCNVGATSPKESGDYFAWGEIQPKSEYSLSNYTLYGKDGSELSSAGIIDSRHIITISYDTANINWGGSWRMPTLNDILELIDTCIWRWTKLHNTYGYEVIGPNNLSIFLPVTGFKHNNELYDKYANYWCADLSCWLIGSPNYTVGAYVLNFGENFIQTTGDSCSDGLTIRPVSD